MPKYLAVDLGAESGRVTLGELQNGVLRMTEVHRFSNDPVEYNGSLHWDVPRLWFEIQRGIGEVNGGDLDGIAVDSWGIDYALLGEKGELLGNPYHYRDRRTSGILEKVCAAVPRGEIYNATGIQFMAINTLYQLAAANEQTPRLLGMAERLLTIPDLFHFWLTGEAVCEFTNASTTQMCDPRTKTWATDLLNRLGLPHHFLGPIVEPCSIIGAASGIPVIAPASHDTGSAVAAIEAREGTAFLSSGTWSLVGMEVDAPVINDTACSLNFTNEGGVCGTTRLLKNVMGLWMLQGCRKSLAGRGTNYSYEELAEAAASAPEVHIVLDPDDPSFLRPDCMLAAIDGYCRRTGQHRPQTPGEYARAVLESLVLRYRTVLDELEQLTNTRIHTIRVIGGGSLNRVLNQWTANGTGRRVLAGPVEATALGNIAAQMLATGEASSLAECREIIARSNQSVIFEPQNTATWENLHA